MKNSNDTMGNRTRDLPTCSAVPQPTAPPAACPFSFLYASKAETAVLMLKMIGAIVCNSHPGDPTGIWALLVEDT